MSGCLLPPAVRWSRRSSAVSSARTCTTDSTWSGSTFRRCGSGPEDIPELLTHFARQMAQRLGHPVSITPAALAALTHHSWPGNVRELRNYPRARRGAGSRRAARLPRTSPSPTAPGPARTATDNGSLDLRSQVEAVEREAIQRALQASKGNRQAGRQPARHQPAHALLQAAAAPGSLGSWQAGRPPRLLCDRLTPIIRSGPRGIGYLIPRHPTPPSEFRERGRP